MKDFIMDYSSTIDDLKDSIIIEVESIAELNSRVKRIEKYYYESAKNLQKNMENCSNKFFNSLKIEHNIESEIKIMVQNI